MSSTFNKKKKDPVQLSRKPLRGSRARRAPRLSEESRPVRHVYQEIDPRVHIVLAQETLLGKNREYSVPGYACYRCQCHLSGKAYRGIAAFVRKDLRAIVGNLQTPSSSDLKEVKIWWGGKKYQCWNWYQPPSDNGTHRFTRTLVADNANVHHLAIGYENSDAVGEWVVDLMNGSNLTSLVTERSELTYLHSGGDLFRPDIALQGKYPTTSAPIACRPSLPSTVVQGRDNKPRWNFRKANWPVYSDTLDNALSKMLPNSVSISELNEVFTRAVILAARRGIPQGVVRKYLPIWTTEFAQSVAKRKQARREYLKSKTTTNRKRTTLFAEVKRRFARSHGQENSDVHARI
ncbi:RNA-directed DNA polymerase from mobile element jockey-like [Plakobranchus ocellatus]|uniref:RNA-directed DNA polymerase from mobile element jockey-like n=1 Tax=Plakobranchus ocellatus TaxID=259542 RepID=A0AAV3XSQ5_9GAST|nr:RNA-directed DNA polymerase from mobile element jockey-like [Plakobranchus ocellatus]